MSGAVTASVVGAVASAALQSALKPKAAATPKVPDVQAPPQSQAAKAPDEATRRQNAAATYGASKSSTMLTDSAGIAPADLLLGKNQLLGQ